MIPSRLGVRRRTHTYSLPVERTGSRSWRTSHRWKTMLRARR